jgi:hypothetical protein
MPYVPARRVEPAEQLDYYLVAATPGGHPEAVAVEEFVLRDDGTATGIDSTVWTSSNRSWHSSRAFSRGMRADAGLRERLRPVDRLAAGAALRQLGGGDLPDEARLRAYFLDRQVLPCSPALRLTTEQPPPGFRDRHRYRILFAGELGRRGLQCLRLWWRLEPVESATDPTGRLTGRAHRLADGHELTWELRRVGPGLGWSVDLTACLGDGPADAVPALLRDLRQRARLQGLIPVTVERLG